jgi:ABC-type multidrug transport system ATPase subunit
MASTEAQSGLQVAWTDLSQSFRSKKIFTLSATVIPSGTECLIQGRNGSGKSTLGRIISGELTPTAGQIAWALAGQRLDAETIVHSTHRISPATALHPELTISELIAFQGHFRTWRHDPLDLLERANMRQHLSASFRTLSSGMQQRVKLALALASDSGLIVLDEPCANLDEPGKAWYRECVQAVKGLTTLIICSNNRKEDYISPDVVVEL